MIKRILLTSENYYPVGGGIEQFLRGLAEYLTEQGYNVFIYTQSYPKKRLVGERKLKEGVVHYSSLMIGSMKNPFGVMGHIGEFAQYIKEKKIDIIFANNHNSLAWIRAGQKARVPVIYGCHGVGLMDPFKNRFLKPDDEISWGFPNIKDAWKWLRMQRRPLWKRALLYPFFFLPIPMGLVRRPLRNYWLYKQALGILNSADGRYGNSALTATLFENQKNTFGFPLAINASNKSFSNHYFPEIDEDFLSRFKLKSKQYILCPGRLNHIKGQEYALLALQYTKDKTIKLVFTGNASLFEGEKMNFGAYGERLIKLSRELGVEDRVVFTGLMNFEEMRKLYSGALVSVIPSIWLETFGYVTLESMACETPVIVTSNCGSSECVDSSSGFIIDRKNEKQIADILNKHSGEFIKMGKAAREKVLLMYDWKVSGQKYIDMFNKIYE